MPALQAMLGKEKAAELVKKSPEVLKGRVATLHVRARAVR
jgi:hypothetical protein